MSPISAIAIVLALQVFALVSNARWSAQDMPIRGTGHTDPEFDPLLVGVSDETTRAVLKYAKARGIEGVTAEIQTWRAVHASLMDRLVTARPLALVWDYWFRTLQAGDKALSEAAQRLQLEGIPVVFACARYQPDGRPDLSPTIVNSLGPQLRHGHILARNMVVRPGEFVLAVKSYNSIQSQFFVVPNLALAAISAVVSPRHPLQIKWFERRQIVELLSSEEVQAGEQEIHRLRLSGVYRSEKDILTGKNGDLVGYSIYPLSPPNKWASRTVPYERLLQSSPEQLRKLVEGRMLIVGDIRKSRHGFTPDRHLVKLGIFNTGELPGCFLLADAVQNIERGTQVRPLFPVGGSVFIVLLLVGSLSWLAPVIVLRAKEGRGPQAGIPCLLALWCPLGLIASLLIMTYTRSYLLVHGGTVGASLMAPAALALFLKWALNRWEKIVLECTECWKRIDLGSERKTARYVRHTFRGFILGRYVLPARVFENVFAYEYARIVNDFADYVRRYRTKFARAWLYVWFTIRITVLALHCVVAVVFDTAFQYFWDLIQRNRN